MSTLRKQIIRLAHERADLRRHLLRVLAAESEDMLLLDLATKLENLGFDFRESIEDYVQSGGRGWRNARELLAALSKDVWGGWANVGEPGEKHIYQEADKIIHDVMRRVH